MIKKRLLPILASAIMATTAVFAQNGNGNGSGLCCDPCCDFSCECSTWTTYAGWIFWSARGCELDYAIDYDGSTSISDVHRVDPDHQHGFYVGFHKTCDELCFDARYTYFRDKEKALVKEASNGYLAGTHVVPAVSVVSQSSIELAKARWDLDYDVLDFAGCYLWDCNDCFQAGAQGGVKIAFLDNSLDVMYSTGAEWTSGTNTFDKIILRNEFKGYGAGMGAMGKFKSNDCFEFFSTFGVDLLVADIDRHYTYKTTSNGGATFTTQVALVDHCWRMVTVINYSIGASWILCDTDCWSSALAIGYEVHHWLSTGGFLVHQHEGNEITFDRYVEDLGFDGLFARMGVTF